MTALPYPKSQSEPKSVTILGSTGSIGKNTLKLIRHHPQRFRVEALTARRNGALLAEQARAVRPRLVVIGDEAEYPGLKDALGGSGIPIEAGDEALSDAAARPSDIVMAAIVGAAGLSPTLAAIRRGATVALANKECLVCAGELFMKEVRQHGATLLPVDSEHNAIFQVFDFAHPERVEKLILTASGGPFRGWTRAQMAEVTPEQAVAHPNWRMGAKISVDSATMINKGLEMIEAFHLFPIAADQIEAIIHPESIVHSMVQYVDGSVLAQMGNPDMVTPIAHTLAWPDRVDSPNPRLNLAELGALTFNTPDETIFPALRLAREAMEAGGGAPTVLNAANEVAVQAFLDGHIRFLQITDMVEVLLDKLGAGAVQSLADIAALDAQVRAEAQEHITTVAA